MYEIDNDVAAVYSMAGLDPANPQGMGALVRGLYGEQALVLLPPPFPEGIAQLFRDAGRLRLRARKGTAIPTLAWLIALAIARHHLRPDSPNVCDLAQGLLMPTPALDDFVSRWGEDAGQLSSIFMVPYTIAASRLRRSHRADRSGVYRLQA